MSAFEPTTPVKLKNEHKSRSGRIIPKNTVGRIKKVIEMKVSGTELKSKWYEVEFEKYGTISRIEHDKLELAP